MSVRALQWMHFGNLFISDQLNNRIRKVDTNGIITTIAGNGTAAFSGDGGAATNASLSGPAGIAFDGSGNLYISDIGNKRIRKVGFGFDNSPILTLNSVMPNNAGYYQVIVSSPSGSVTSSVAYLTFVLPPKLPHTATATTITAYGEFVVAVTNLDGGFGYTNTPLVRIIGGGGSGATAVAVVSNGGSLPSMFWTLAMATPTRRWLSLSRRLFPIPLWGLCPYRS